jgi:hypothetical protein
MSSDEESRNHLQRVASSKLQVSVQDFQALILPPVPVARGPNANTNVQHQQQQQQQQPHTSTHSQTHSSEVGRRPGMSTTRSQHSNSSEPYPKPSNKGGVRGRVTVVCAEVCYSPFLFIFVSFHLLTRAHHFRRFPQCKRLKVGLLFSAITLISHIHVLASV